MTNRLHLNFHGLRMRVEGGDADAVNEIARDFAYFQDDRFKSSPDAVLTLHRRPAPEALRVSNRSFRWKGCRFTHRAGARRVSYEDGAAIRYDFRSETGAVYAESFDLLRELAYLTIHSRVGQLLEQRGLYRAHALGFVFKGEAGLLLLPEGGGKTTLAFELLRRVPELTLLGDDIPLLSGDGQTLHPFPLRLGFRDEVDGAVHSSLVRTLTRRRHGRKRLVDQSFYGKRVAPPSPLRWILAGERTGVEMPLLTPCSRLRMGGPLAKGLVIGIGTPQVLELLSFGALLNSAVQRASVAWKAMNHANLYRFRMSDSAADNADALGSLFKVL